MPHGAKELFARKHVPRCGGQVRQEVKLTAGEFDHSTVDTYLPSGDVDRQPCKFHTNRPVVRVDRGGAAEVEALSEVDAFLAEKVPRFFVFHPLGNRLDLEGLSQADDGPDEVLVSRVGEQVPYELDVDLQVPDRQILQVGEAAKAGAEVVESKAASKLGQALGERFTCFEFRPSGRSR